MINPRNELEKTILKDLEIQQGLKYGEPRDGHPEGSVENHVIEILERFDTFNDPPEVTDKLRFAAIVHDSFQFKVDQRKPKIGENNHGMLARKFAERYISDKILLDIIELHDAYYYLWIKFEKKGIFSEEEFRKLADRIKDGLVLYLKFMFIDGTTGDKKIEPRIWFHDKLIELGYLENTKPAQP